MQRQKAISGLLKLSDFISQFLDASSDQYSNSQEQLAACLRKAEIENPWFTLENQRYALAQWAELLNENHLQAWLSAYEPAKKVKRVGLILAGNLPLVGLHDVLSVILSGHFAVIKLSSKDKVLMPFLLAKWEELGSENLPFELVEKLQNFKAVIATGSNNTARYLDYYFKDYLSIIRKNRTSLAVLTGNETAEQLALLGEDIFRYFGLGCRNVTRLFVPEDFVLDRFFEAVAGFGDIIHHNKYANNYEYNRAVYLLNQQTFWDNNFVLLREDEHLFSPLSVVNFTRYKDIAEVTKFIAANEQDIQVVVAQPALNFENSVAFGEAQNPDLRTYADRVDTMRFLEVL